jgi:hypothetical protein
MITNGNIPKTADVGTDRVLRLNYEAQNDTIPTNAVVFNKAPDS